jgi:hypothetical protein
MAKVRRWDPCISHRGPEVGSFIKDYFADQKRSVLFVAGAGFDPRTPLIGQLLASACVKIHAVFIQENRPKPPAELVKRAADNAAQLSKAFSGSTIAPIEIFGTDGAVVGGRNIVNLMNRQDYDGVTDVVVDTSALSVGTSFPLIRYFFERKEKGLGPENIHIFVAHDPTLDGAISSIASDTPGYVHGFRGRISLDGSSEAARLWLPQLAAGRRTALSKIRDFVQPHDTCPILPFPASNPRMGDLLAEEFLVEFENAWTVDPRNVVYAAEDDPLDLYRTILGLDDLRRPVFKEVGGSLLVLSPLGSKIMALGALMAALERDLPIAYLESIGYNIDNSVPETTVSPYLVHVWLEGDAYPLPRPPLQVERTAGP